MLFLDSANSRELYSFKVTKLASAFLFGLVAYFSWAISSPAGSSPDENFHIGSIWCGPTFSENGCQPIGNDMSRHSIDVVTPHVMDICFIFYSDQSANCKNDQRSKNPTLIANNGLYPSGFYRTLNLFVTSDPAYSVLAMRLFNSVIFLILFLAAIVLSTGIQKMAIYISVLITSVPLSNFLIASINPSSWAYSAAATNWVFLKNYLEDNFQNKNYKRINTILYFVTIAMALGSRWDVMLYLCISTIAILIMTYGSKFFKDVKKLVLLLSSLVVLSYFSLFNRISADSANLTGLGGGNTDLNITFLLRSNLENLITLYAGSTGYSWGIGWLDTKLPEIVGILGLIIWGIWIAQIVSQKSLKSIISTGFLLASLIAIPMYVLVSESLMVGQQVQPRYLLPLLPIFFGVGITNIRNINSHFRNQLIASAFLVSFANFLSLHTNLRRYITGLDYNEFNLNLNKEWWWNIPISPNIVLIFGSISFLVMTLILVSFMDEKKTYESSSLEASHPPRIV